MLRLVAVVYILLALRNSASADDRETAKKLEALGGKVTLDKAGTATEVTFLKSDSLAADEYRLIGSLAGLKSLTLYGKCDKLTDETVQLLKGLTALERLNPDQMMLTDDGYRHLTALTSLKSLSLFHVGFKLRGFTGAGFAHLKPLENLRSLTFGGNATGDEAIAAVATLTQLRSLQVWHTWATPAAADLLAGMSHLTSLRWGQSLPRYDGKPRVLALTPETVPALAKLTDLESLQLDEARFGFDDVKPLAGLKKLKKLTLGTVDIPADDVARLRELLKGVEVVWKPLSMDERWRLDSSLGPPVPVEVHKDVTYYDGADKDKEGFHTLDLYTPKGAKNAPVLLFVHGGGWSRKDRDGYARGRGGPHTWGFAGRGFVVVTISYRLSPKHKHPAHVEDVARAIAWTKGHVEEYGGDPKHLFLTGHSAGGHLVSLVVTDLKYLKAHGLSATDVKGVIPVSGVFTIKGGSKVWGTDEAASDASPIRHVREGLPPFLAMAGDTTDVEKWLAGNGKEFTDKLAAAKVKAQFVTIKDRDHSTIVTKYGTPGDQAAEEVVRFVKANGGKLPTP